MLWLAADVHDLRGGYLHAESHLVGVDPGGDLRVAHPLEPHLVEPADRLQRVALDLLVNAARVGEIKDGVAAGAELYALVDRGQEAAAPVGIAAARAFLARAEDDEAGQILRFAAQAVADPGPHARPAEDHRPGGHHDLAGSVVERVGGNALDDGQVVHNLGQMGQQFGQLDSRLAMPGELELRAQQPGIRIDERRAIALEQIGRGQFAIKFGELGLVVEELQMARAARHEQKNHPFGLGGEMGRPGRQRIDALGRGRGVAAGAAA